MTHGHGHKANDVFAPRGARQSGVSADFFALGYDAFGSLLPGRNYSSDSYRFGFQGQEKDDEMHGATGTSLAFEYRIHDARIGRFLSIDPLAAKYPWNSPYAFSENRVVDAVELEGLESQVIHQKYNPANQSMTVIDAVDWRDVEPDGSREHGGMGDGTLYFTEYPATEFGPAHLTTSYSRSWGEAFSDLFSDVGGIWGSGSEGMRDKGRDGAAWDPEAFMLVVDKLKKGFPDKFNFDKYKPGRQDETADKLSEDKGRHEGYVKSDKGGPSGDSEPGAAGLNDTITITIHEEGYVKDGAGGFRSWSGNRQIRTTPQDTVGKNYKVIKN